MTDQSQAMSSAPYCPFFTVPVTSAASLPSIPLTLPLDDQLLGFLVGIDDYGYRSNIEPLANCANDARAVAAALNELFPDRALLSVITSGAPDDTSLTKSFIESGIASMAGLTTPEDWLVFYCSGHGYRFPDNPDQLYLAPQGVFDEHDPADFVAIDHVLDVLTAAPARVKICVLDASYSGPVKAGSVGTNAGIGVKGQGQVIVITACQGDQVASSGSPDGKTSLFTYYLLKALREDMKALEGEGRLTVASLCRYITEYVAATAREYGIDQRPACWLS